VTPPRQKVADPGGPWRILEDSGGFWRILEDPGGPEQKSTLDYIYCQTPNFAYTHLQGSEDLEELGYAAAAPFGVVVAEASDKCNVSASLAAAGHEIPCTACHCLLGMHAWLATHGEWLHLKCGSPTQEELERQEEALSEACRPCLLHPQLLLPSRQGAPS
jgi:hypothetical protein